MLVAQRDLKLAPFGTVRAGQPVPDALWGKLRARTQRVLLGERRVVVTTQTRNAQPRRGRKQA